MRTNVGHVTDIETTTGAEKYPSAIRHLFEGRHKAKLGDVVGVTQFGVNLTTLDPGCISALRHWHEGEDEFIYIVSGELVRRDDNGDQLLSAGSFAGFPAGDSNGHHLVNESDSAASYIEVGSRRPGKDVVHYPDHDIPPVQR